MQINRIGGKFEILERGILIEICRDIQSADEVIEVCPPDYVADFETDTTRPIEGLQDGERKRILTQDSNYGT